MKSKSILSFIAGAAAYILSLGIVYGALFALLQFIRQTYHVGLEDYEYTAIIITVILATFAEIKLVSKLNKDNMLQAYVVLSYLSICGIAFNISTLISSLLRSFNIFINCVLLISNLIIFYYAKREGLRFKNKEV